MPKGISDDQLTAEDLQLQIQSLKRHSNMERIKVSQAINLMTQYIMERVSEDHIATPDFPREKKSNPWIEQKKCSII